MLKKGKAYTGQICRPGRCKCAKFSTLCSAATAEGNNKARRFPRTETKEQRGINIGSYRA